ncbi:hypothetical protein EMPS_11456 [Entomortierella parvispora]|uniref:Uncharacterized protein n=1 Tax=Entomortierella parvispora TaxID=205924 RepID=A0A9P3HNK4_9FUNG|nr:hypothetical protein EMPS_11456 [Entomortierella parvispora]
MDPAASPSSQGSTPMPMSAFYRRKLEQHQLTPEEWTAVRFAVIKHTAIAAATTVSLGMSAFFFARSKSWSRGQALALATAGNVVGLGLGGVIAMESGMKTVATRLEGSGSELLYLMDRYSKATLKEKLGDKAAEELLISDSSTGSATAARMIPPKSN